MTPNHNYQETSHSSSPKLSNVSDQKPDTSDRVYKSPSRSNRSHPQSLLNIHDNLYTANSQRNRDSGSNSDVTDKVKVRFTRNAQNDFTINQAESVNYPIQPAYPIQINVTGSRSTFPNNAKKLDFEKISESAIYQTGTTRYGTNQLADFSPEDMLDSITNRSRTSRHSRKSGVGNRRKSIIKNMPIREHKDKDPSHPQHITEGYTPDNKMLELANTMAKGVGQVIDHFEHILHMEYELSANWKSYGAWSEQDVGTLVKLIVNGAKERALRLLEAYKVIGLITKEIGLDFPNRVTLLKGKKANTDGIIQKDKVKSAIINLYNKVGSIALTDLDYYIELAQN